MCVAICCLAAGLATALTPSERCAQAQKELAAQREADISRLVHDTRRQVSLVPIRCALDVAAHEDTLDAISTDTPYPSVWSVPVAQIRVRRTTDFSVDLFGDDGNLVGIYEFENVTRGIYAFDLNYAVAGGSLPGILKVRLGEKFVGEAQRVFFGGGSPLHRESR